MTTVCQEVFENRKSIENSRMRSGKSEFHVPYFRIPISAFDLSIVLIQFSSQGLEAIFERLGSQDGSLISKL